MAYLEIRLEKESFSYNKIKERWHCDLHFVSYLTTSYRDAETKKVTKNRKRITNYIAFIFENQPVDDPDSIVPRFDMLWSEKLWQTARISQSVYNQFFLTGEKRFGYSLRSKLLLWNIDREKFYNLYINRITEYRDNFSSSVREHIEKTERTRKRNELDDAETKRLWYEAGRGEEFEENQHKKRLLTALLRKN